MAENVKKPIDESGLHLNGQCKAIASSPDGYTYVLMYDKRLIRIDCDGEQQEIPIPLNKGIRNEDDYFCDMAVDTKAAYFCGYNYSSIQTLDLRNPKELRKLNISYKNKEIKPMMISRSSDGWCLKDFNMRTFKVENRGKTTLLSENSEVVLDNRGRPVIKALPEQDSQGNFLFPGKLLNEDGSVKWTAPVPKAPKVVTNVEYLGFDSDQNREIYLVSTSAGDQDSNLTAYAVNKGNKIVAQRVIPNSSIDFIMRYCKLAADGSIIAVYADPQAPEERVIIKRFELQKDSPAYKG